MKRGREEILGPNEVAGRTRTDVEIKKQIEVQSL